MAKFQLSQGKFPVKTVAIAGSVALVLVLGLTFLVSNTVGSSAKGTTGEQGKQVAGLDSQGSGAAGGKARSHGTGLTSQNKKKAVATEGDPEADAALSEADLSSEEAIQLALTKRMQRLDREVDRARQHGLEDACFYWLKDMTSSGQNLMIVTERESKGTLTAERAAQRAKLEALQDNMRQGRLQSSCQSHFSRTVVSSATGVGETITEIRTLLAYALNSGSRASARNASGVRTVDNGNPAEMQEELEQIRQQYLHSGGRSVAGRATAGGGGGAGAPASGVAPGQQQQGYGSNIMPNVAAAMGQGGRSGGSGGGGSVSAGSGAPVIQRDDTVKLFGAKGTSSSYGSSSVSASGSSPIASGSRATGGGGSGGFGSSVGGGTSSGFVLETSAGAGGGSSVTSASGGGQTAGTSGGSRTGTTSTAGRTSGSRTTSSAVPGVLPGATTTSGVSTSGSSVTTEKGEVCVTPEDGASSTSSSSSTASAGGGVSAKKVSISSIIQCSIGGQKCITDPRTGTYTVIPK
ncbi:MAG: hypothetical protein SFZ03_09435 [Candidatus Melainabacteria bacterium]|nr:hypothetical protein [Candidatus Melainabacteria bacterium]